MRSHLRNPGLYCVLFVWFLWLTGLRVLNAQDPDKGPKSPFPSSVIPVENSSPDLKLREYVQSEYGIDQQLINGKQFYFKYFRVQHDPYFLGESPLLGEVTLNGKTYRNLRLNYDIYEQFLVLEYSLPSGGVNKIILNSEYTDSFTIEDLCFEKLSLDERGPLFYEVIRSGDLVCYIHWEKHITAVQNDMQYYGSFTAPMRRYLLDSGKGTSTFHSRKSFTALFPEPARKELRRILRTRNIRFRNADPRELTGLIGFASDVLQRTTGN
jgi:hypothetical protein